MKIRPLRPLVFPAVLLAIFSTIAALLPSFKAFDDTLIRVIETIPRTWAPTIGLVTKLGDAPVLIVIALTVSLWELVRRNYVRSLVMAGSLIAMPAFFLVKETVRRARPVSEFLAEHDILGYSFPSGHGTGTMAVFGMIAVLAYSHLKGRIRLAVVALSAIIIVTVSFSRIYLGAHYPTDIIAGWLLAIVVISLLRSLSLYLAKIRPEPNIEAIEDTTEDPDLIEK